MQPATTGRHKGAGFAEAYLLINHEEVARKLVYVGMDVAMLCAPDAVAAIVGQKLTAGRAVLANGTRRAWNWARTREGAAFYALLLFSVAIRLVLAPYHGFFGDVQADVGWGNQLDHSFLRYYTSSGSNYPPISAYLYGLLVATCNGFCHVSPMHQLSVPAFWMKVPTLAVDMVTTGLVYVLTRKVLAVRAAFITAASFALAPAVLFDGALWGQTDGLPMLFVVVALLCALRRHSTVSGASLAVALMLKPQPVIFVPLLLVYVLRWFGWREAAKCAAAACLTCLVASAPYLLPPRPEILVFVRNVSGSIDQAPFASVSAFNLWWFLGVQFVGYHVPLFDGLTASTLGDAGFGAIVAVALAGVWLDRSASRLFAAAAIIATGFFVLTPLQRERYLYPAIVLFLIAAVYDHRYTRHYLVASITTFLNMAAIVVLYYTGSESGFNLAPEGSWLSNHGAYLVVIAGVNDWVLVSATMSFVLASWRTWRPRQGRTTALQVKAGASGEG